MCERERKWEKETESSSGSRRLVCEPLLFLSFPLPFSFFAFWTTSLLTCKVLGGTTEWGTENGCGRCRFVAVTSRQGDSHSSRRQSTVVVVVVADTAAAVTFSVVFVQLNDPVPEM